MWKVLLYFSPRNIITVSHSEKIKIKKINRNKNITVIRNINQLESICLPNNIYLHQEFKYDIIMIGHYVNRKNYPLALNSIALASQKLGKTIRVCIVGNDTHSIRHLIESDSVIISTFSSLDEYELIKLIMRSKFYLNSSSIEGYCIPFIECQSYGLIPIVPNHCIFQENCFSKIIYYSSLGLEEYTKAICNAFIHSDSIKKPSLENIDRTKQSSFLNKNIYSSIDRFMQEICS